MPELKDIAVQIRRDIVRMVHGANSGHPGGSLGCADFFTALYFKMMKHEHHFKSCANGTIMIDMIHFETPYGAMGKWFNALYLTKYMRRLIEQRNKTIKEFAETDKWKKLLQK